MTATHEPGVAVPDAGTPVPGGRPGIRRILVPIRSADQAVGPLAAAARVCGAANVLLCLVHVRIYDPPLRGSGRFYPQTRSEAAAIPDEALPIAWAYGLPAATAVIAARRREVASAIARQASAWRADMIIMTRRPGLAICRLVLGSVPDQVMASGLPGARRPSTGVARCGQLPLTAGDLSGRRRRSSTCWPASCPASCPAQPGASGTSVRAARGSWRTSVTVSVCQPARHPACGRAGGRRPAMASGRIPAAPGRVTGPPCAGRVPGGGR